MQSYESLYEKLTQYHANGRLAMHMPGHKRNDTQASYLKGLAAGLDITEIDGFDNLHAPQGILLRAQQLAAKLWGAEESFFLINGSTSGILAAFYATLQRGDEILLSRGSHKSVYHAIELFGLLPHFILPSFIPDSTIFGSITPNQVEQLLRQYPNIRAVFLTSPSYEGIISDIAQIAKICHAKNIPLLVDEAHGAHLGLSDGFPAGAVHCDADLVVQSLHKTLPSLTQTAILHCCGNRIDSAQIRHALSIFQSSSPSYLLMASIDGCVTLLHQHPELFKYWRDNLRIFDDSISNLYHVQALMRTTPLPQEVFAYDPGKILIHAPGYSGSAVMELLRKEFSIELEMATSHYALAMTGLGDTRKSLSQLAEALIKLDAILAQQEICDWEFESESEIYGFLPSLSIAPETAVHSPRRLLSWEQCPGHIAAEYVWAYPPGIPILIPGETIDTGLARILAHISAIPGRLHSTFNGLSKGIYVVSTK